MTDSASPLLRLRLQGDGGNNNTWGDFLNSGGLQLLENASHGMTTLVITGDHVLSSSNFVADESRQAILKFTGSPSAAFSITIPSLTHVYQCWNATGQVGTVTAGSGTTVAVQPGEAVTVSCDAVNCIRTQGLYFAGQQISGVADPTSPQQAATMAYVTAQIMGAFSGSFPGQTGANGWALFTNGVAPFWKQIASTDLSDFNSRILGVQVALAVAL